MKADKKRFANAIHFILPVRIGWVEDLPSLDLAELKAAIVAVTAPERIFLKETPARSIPPQTR